MSAEGTDNSAPSIDIWRVNTAKIPYKEGTESFLVAQRMIAGDKDAEKTASELKAGPKTISNVK